MQRYYYVFELSAKQTLFLSLFVFVTILLLEGFLLSATLSAFIAIISLAVGLLSVSITLSSFQPEAPTTFEVHATLPTPLWKSILETLVFNWGVLWFVMSIGTIAFLAVHRALNFEKFVFLPFGYSVIVLFFGNLTFFGTVIGRETRLGILIGLSVVGGIYVLTNLMNTTIATASIFDVANEFGEPLLWIGYRFFYIFFALFFLWAAMRKLLDTDFLLTGSSLKPIQTMASKRLSFWRRLQLPIPLNFSTPRIMGIIIYESVLSVLKSPVFIVIIALWLIFSATIFLEGVFNQVTEYVSIMETGAISLPLTMQLFFVLLLPFTVVITAAADQRTHVEQVILSIISPRMYLVGKVLGITIGVVGACILGAIPAIVIMFSSVLSGKPIYFVGFITNLCLGILPLLVYTTVFGVLTGILARSKYALFWGGGLSIVMLVAFFSTANTIPGNFIFPSGRIIGDTIAYPIYVASDISENFGYDPAEFLIVPKLFLFFPLISTFLQLVILSWVAIRKYEKLASSI